MIDEKPIGEVTLSEIYRETDIEHFGILGQKWGVRRYQNEDRTLTEEGKARYRKESEYDSKSNTWKSKDARHLTDEELNKRNSRLQRERQYRDLTEPPIKKATKEALKKILIATAIGVTAAAMTKNYKSWMDKGSAWLKSGGAERFKAALARGKGARWVL